MTHTATCRTTGSTNTWTRCDCYEPDTDWAPDEPCGGISINGAVPPLCEVHMKPWGHRTAPTTTHAEDTEATTKETDRG